MTDRDDQITRVSQHYTHGSLVDAIEAGLRQLGKGPGTVEIADLAPVDEFHIGGRQASEAFLDQFGLQPDHRVLDVGCGLGGPARFTAQRYGVRVDGIDLTPEYVETGTVLNRWVGLDDRIVLSQGNALQLPYADDSFDAAYLMHVGMNIADKAALFAAVYRTLRPGGVFGVYDVMQASTGAIEFPVPWASEPATSHLAAPESYRDALRSVGFAIEAERDRREFALAFFERLKAASAAADGPPPLGLHILMGETARQKIANMVGNIAAGRIAPVEMIARKPQA